MDWKLQGFRISKTNNKKYDAILKSGDKIKYMPFGDKRYEQYKDRIRSYSHLDHNDKKRRANFIARMKGFLKPGKYTPAYFSLKYLW